MHCFWTRLDYVWTSNGSQENLLQSITRMNSLSGMGKQEAGAIFIFPSEFRCSLLDYVDKTMTTSCLMCCLLPWQYIGQQCSCFFPACFARKNEANWSQQPKVNTCLEYLAGRTMYAAAVCTSNLNFQKWDDSAFKTFVTGIIIFSSLGCHIWRNSDRCGS